MSTLSDDQQEFYANQDQKSTVLRGLVVAPAAGGLIVSSSAMAAGTYKVECFARYGGTPDVIDNMDIRLGGTVVATLPVLPVANGAPIPLTLILEIPLNTQIFVRAPVAGAVGAVYICQLVVTKIGNI